MAPLRVGLQRPNTALRKDPLMSRVRIAVVCAAVVLQSAAGSPSIAADNDFV